jgi:gluconolactonase
MKNQGNYHMKKHTFLFLFSLSVIFLPSAFAQAQQKTGSLADVKFIEGHWKGMNGPTALEAVWTAPAGDNIVGFIRMMKEDKVTLYELFAFEQTEQGPVALVKHFRPGLIGVEEKDKSDRYAFVEASEGRAIFEKQGESLRVLYEKRSADQFVIALGRTQDEKWVFKDLFVFNRVQPETGRSGSGSLKNLAVGEPIPTLVSKQFKFTEGPATDKAGNVFFTDQPNDKIWKYGTDGQLSVFMENSGRSNGLYFDQKGNLLSAADEHNQLWSISPKGKVTVLLKDYEGKKLNGPNDLWVHPTSGGIYFTDPYYQRPYWERKSPEITGQKVYFLPKGKKVPVIVDDNLEQPNGIIGTPDGQLLYVADIKAKKTYRYRIGADGKLTDRQLFVEQGSDGMTIDNQGNIYLTGKGVTVYSPQGQKIQQIDVPAGWTANVTFGGKDRNVLFITASEAVFTLPMQVKGVQ